MSIEIRPLPQLNAADINPLLGPFVCHDTYRVRYYDEPERSGFELELVPLAEPFVNRYEHLEEDYLREYLCGANLSLGAYEGDQLVGVLIAETREWNYSLWVWEFHVAPEQRGQGIGRMLMEQAAAQAKAAGMRVMVCETQNQNSNAIKAYRKLGFRPEGIDISYYTNEDYPERGIAVFMKRRL